MPWSDIAAVVPFEIHCGVIDNLFVCLIRRANVCAEQIDVNHGNVLQKITRDGRAVDRLAVVKATKEDVHYKREPLAGKLSARFVLCVASRVAKLVIVGDVVANLCAACFELDALRKAKVGTFVSEALTRIEAWLRVHQRQVDVILGVFPESLAIGTPKRVVVKECIVGVEMEGILDAFVVCNAYK